VFFVGLAGACKLDADRVTVNPLHECHGSGKVRPAGKKKKRASRPYRLPGGMAARSVAPSAPK